MRVWWLSGAILLLLVAACGGGGSSSGSSGDNGGNGGDQAAHPLANAKIVDPPPNLPGGTTNITYYYEFTASADASAALLTLDVIKNAPLGQKTTWYTYENGQWKAIQAAFPSGGIKPIVQTTFDVRPANIIVLAEP